MKDFAPRGDARFPTTKPMHRRCACHEEVTADKWAHHVDTCVIRAKKQELAKEKKS